MVKQSFSLSRQSTIDIYLFSEQFSKREILRNEDYLTISNLRYMPALDFNLEGLKGKKIINAVLSLKVITPDYPLEVEITTISHNWNEKYANYYQYDDGKAWAGDKWLSDVMMSAGNSRYFREKTNYDPESGILKINIPSYVLYAMANGQSFGFGLIDCKSRGYGSREGEGWNVIKKFNLNKNNDPVPVLEVEYTDAEFTVPESVSNFSGIGAETPETLDKASVILNWSACSSSDEYRYYNIYISENETDISKMEKVEEYFIPVYDPDNACTGTEIDNLKAETVYNFAITVSNGINESKPVYTKVETLASRKLPVVCRADTAESETVQATTIRKDGYNVYILDEISKVDPVSGGVYGSDNGQSENGLANVADYNSSLFNGQKVCMTGVPGEKLAFQFVVENLAEGAQGFTAEIKNSCLDPSCIQLNRVWYLKSKESWYPEVAVPMEDTDKFAVPFEENKVENQKYQAVLVDINLPEILDEGIFHFDLVIGSAAGQTVIPVELDIKDVKLDRAKFILELNGYVCLPDCAGMDRSDPNYWLVEEEYYRTAFKHNMSINILPYTHFGTVQEDFAPEIEMIDGLPRVTDWSKWDAHFEKYLDGSYLLETEGIRVPITHIYLPFHENWPMPINEYYKVKVDRGPDDYPENLNEHKLKASSPYTDFMPEYREGIKAVLKDFIRHIDEKGWKNIEFQYFFNNKHFYKQKGFVDRCKNRKGLEMWLTEQTCGNDGQGTSWWLLDEPHFRDDWEAIHYYGTILKEAQRELNSGYNVKFRVDISCYNQLFNFLDGVLDTSIVAGRPYNEREDLMRKRKEKFGENYWVYGGWNPVDQPNMNSFLWIIEAYLKGGSGIVPWYNFGLDVNYEVPDNCAGLYPGKRFDSNAPMVSLRLKSGRKALEITRYLDAFKKAFGYSDLQLKSYVSSFLRLGGEAVVRHRDDAGLMKYNASNQYKAIEDMKKDIIMKLSVKKA